MAEESKEIKRLKKLFSRASAARTSAYKEKSFAEDFYFNDVEATKSQFTAKQLEFINKSYQIPISTKIAYPIIEQILAFLTGTKPYPRLLAESETVEDWVNTYTKCFHATWSESKADSQIYYWVRDALVTGTGWMRVRPNTFFNESTFNTIIEYIDWRKVAVDPYTRKEDCSDAEYIIIADVMLKKKAEAEYDIELDESHSSSDIMNTPSEEIPEWFLVWDLADAKEDQWVWIREFFEKEERFVYLNENGDMSIKKPIPTVVKNEEKLALGQQIQQMAASMESLAQQGMQAEQTKEQAMMSPQVTNEGADAAFQSMTLAENKNVEANQQKEQMLQEMEQMEAAYDEMPDTLPAYYMTIDKGGEETKVLSMDITRIKKKLIKRTLMVGDKVVERDYVPGTAYPVVPFTFQWGKSPYRTFGVIHYIQDLVKAMNKFWSALIYDMQINNHAKVLYAEGTIEKLEDIQTSWSLPGAWTKYIPHPELPDGGQPQIVPPAPVNQAIVHVLGSLLQLIEYVTGIYGVMQGNSQEAPSTFGATQSLQNFGSQRVKLYSRGLSTSIEGLAKATIEYLQKYAPRDKVMKYFDENGDAQEVQIMSDIEDTQFKVRVDITSSLPTVRQMSAQLLGMVAGQTKNPYVADFLTQYMLKTMEMVDGDELAGQIDVIKQMEGQINQLQQQLDAESKKAKSLENNLYQRSLSGKVDLSAAQADKDIAVAKEKAMPEEQGTEEENLAPEEIML